MKAEKKSQKWDFIHMIQVKVSNIKVVKDLAVKSKHEICNFIILSGGRKVSLFPYNLKYLSRSKLQKWKMSYSKAAFSTVVLFTRLRAAVNWKHIVTSIFKVPCPLCEIAFMFPSIPKLCQAVLTAKEGKLFHLRLMKKHELGVGE